MKLWTIFHYEFTYLVRRVSTWLYIAVLFAFTFIMNGLTTPGDGVYANNTFHLTAITVIGGLIWLVIGASIAGEAAARDVQARMHPLTYTTPVNKQTYLGGRFLAAFAVNALLLLSLPLGVLLSFYLPGGDEGSLLPFRPAAYLSVYCFIALPNAFIVTALQFTFAALSRRVMTSYMASILLAIFAQIIAITIAKLFGNWDLVKLLDPIGVTGIVGNELQTWTPVEKNIRLISLSGMFLLNRILWLAIAGGLLSFTYHRFHFATPATNGWLSRFKRKKKAAIDTPTETTFIRPTSINVPNVERNFGFATYLSQTITIAWVSFKMLARSPVGLTLVAAIAVASAAFASSIMTQIGIPLIPTTPQILAYLAAPVSNLGAPSVVIPLLLMYFVGELVWRERDAGLSDMADAAPVPEWALFTGKFFGIAFIIIVWMALLMAGGIVMQLVLGYNKLQIGLYLQVLFGLQLTDYLLFALLVLVVHVVVNQKIIAYLVVLLVFIFMAFHSLIGVEHKLLVFGAGPGWSYTDMRGFGATLAPWLWFKLYWIAWALLLAVAGRLLWAREREQSFKHRFHLAKHRFSGSTTIIAMVGALLVITVGSYIFYNTNILNEYTTSSDINERKAEYERLYGKYRNTPQPQLVATKLHVEIYPERQQADIRGVYTLVNNDTLPLDTIHLGTISAVALTEIQFNRPATSVVADDKRNHYIYTLKQPLQPGDSLQLNFVIHYPQRGFENNATKELVVENGTSFTNYDLLPAIGYLRHKEINNTVTRKKQHLPARPSLPSLYEAEARKKPASTDNIFFEATIGTAKDEVAVAPGALQGSWTKDDRRYFHYKTDTTIGGEYVILSAKYAVKETQWNHVAIRIYYHPGHAINIERMLRSAKASLAYFTEQFGPYPYQHFTLVERAGNTGGASADASMINYGEQYALMNPDDSPNGFDLPFYILSHEVAHQWFGLARLTPAYVEGAGVLIESLAVYAGMQVLEQQYGEGHLRQYIDYLHSSYAMPRSLATTSLLQADDPFLYYRKGGLAMYALSKYIGKEMVNGALRNLLRKRASGVLPLPTTLNLYTELQQVTPDSLQYLLHDLFKANTYWRLKTTKISAEQTAAGNWQVTLKVQAQKVVVDPSGAEHEVPMNDLLEVGIYEEDTGFDKPLYLQMHRIHSGEQSIKVHVPHKPNSGGIDPNHLMIDLRRDDNVIGLDD